MSNPTRRGTRSSSDTVTLTPARIARLEEELRCELTRVKRRMGDVRPQDVQAEHHWRDADIDPVHGDTLATEVYDMLQARCGVILEALDRIRRGTFGRCIVCGEPIPYERLIIVPETSVCVTCARSRIPPIV